MAFRAAVRLNRLAGAVTAWRWGVGLTGTAPSTTLRHAFDGGESMVDLMEALWDILLGNRLLRWFFIGLLIGLILIGCMILSGSDIEAADALIGIVVSGVLVFGLRLMLWFFNH